MNTIEKFISDIQKIIRYDRANNGGHYSGRRACTQIVQLFEKNNRNLGALATNIGDYWLNSYILTSEAPENEPTEENIARIRAFQGFIDNYDLENFDILTAKDWETLRDFVDDVAEDIDIDSLQNMMSLILANGAL